MIVDALTKAAQEMLHKQRVDSKFHPRPSLSGPERCPRSLVYFGMGFKKKMAGGRLNFIFEDGKMHEDATYKQIKDLNLPFTPESAQMDLSFPAPLEKGKLDFLVKGELDNKLYLVEHKAFARYKFERYWNTDQFPLDNFTQMGLYFWAIQKEADPSIKEGFLIIKNKDTAAFMEFFVHYDIKTDIFTIVEKTDSNGEIKVINQEIKNMVADNTARWNKILDYIAKKTLPAKRYGQDDWQCSYCDYGDKCWEDQQKTYKELVVGKELSQDATDLIAHYCELRDEVNEAGKEKDDLADKIKEILIKENCKEGIAGEYIVQLKQEKQNRINKELLTQAELERVTEPKIIEKIQIKRRSVSK